MIPLSSGDIPRSSDVPHVGGDIPSVKDRTIKESLIRALWLKEELPRTKTCKIARSNGMIPLSSGDIPRSSDVPHVGGDIPSVKDRTIKESLIRALWLKEYEIRGFTFLKNCPF
ncbi:hypothetical protein BDB00DRAFT_872020 [Zychaea mexicana]|uniref:uncharacterized protein n=1 Tax=Zychaea mexicana TaxID=64656 RepID=UPI0022FE3249|nr:uncharacterized protein BDB00DRAFT_875288 [Zychaea mexicana]XP_052980041.1 uncharacterized protein BDB00DRAFT_872020 [Zychaea mexicana]KAI9490555.1 hypothetical protein BDB00DRAFT_875288 [Zychaea mexicana]KAI9493776.1 hypothetical protein BDB00DRAFT_872020 [Zychaea mexicana]